MPILRAIGFGLVIIIIQLLVPRVFLSVEETVVSVFNTAQVFMSVSEKAILKNDPDLPSSRR